MTDAASTFSSSRDALARDHDGMSSIVCNDQSYPARPELLAAIAEAWRRIAAPGTWWSGAERIAIAQAVRDAESCALCQMRKQALSPYQVAGAHQGQVSQDDASAGTGAGVLPRAAIEVIHRLRTDARRVTQKWVAAQIADGLGAERYVELVSLVAIVTALDTFEDALGCARRVLPAPQSGKPTQRRPSAVTETLVWVPTLDADNLQAGESNPFLVHGDKNIHRALSLVPQEVMNFFDLDVELYLRDHEIRDFSREYRAITHAQIELIAGRASALNGCFY